MVWYPRWTVGPVRSYSGRTGFYYRIAQPVPSRIAYHQIRAPKAVLHDAAEQERDWYSSRAWRACRAAFLAANPLCARCLIEDRLTAATIAHHVQERLQRPDLAFDHDNLEALCSPCHTTHHKSRPKE